VNQALIQTAEMFVRLCVSVPLLFIGLLATIDPAAFLTSVEKLARQAQDSIHLFLGPQGLGRLRGTAAIQAGPGVRFSMRMGGLALVVWVVVHAAGVAN
jgi:hypothetical protein